MFNMSCCLWHSGLRDLDLDIPFGAATVMVQELQLQRDYLGTLIPDSQLL